MTVRIENSDGQTVNDHSTSHVLAADGYDQLIRLPIKASGNAGNESTVTFDNVFAATATDHQNSLNQCEQRRESEPYHQKRDFPDPPLDKPAVHEAVTNLANELQNRYIDPAIGARYAEMLRKNLDSGAYDKFASTFDFSDQIMHDLRDVHEDQHLGTMVREKELPITPNGESIPQL